VWRTARAVRSCSMMARFWSGFPTTRGRARCDGELREGIAVRVQEDRIGVGEDLLLQDWIAREWDWR